MRADIETMTQHKTDAQMNALTIQELKERVKRQDDQIVEQIEEIQKLKSLTDLLRR